MKRSEEAFLVAGEIERGIKSGTPPYRPELLTRHQQLVGRIYFGKGDYPRALDYFQKVVQDQARYNARTRAWAFVRLGMIADLARSGKRRRSTTRRRSMSKGARAWPRPQPGNT